MQGQQGHGAVTMARFIRWSAWAAILLALALLVLESLSLSGVQGSDFFVFHDAIKRMLADPATLYNDVRGVRGTAESLQGFLYPPPSVFLLYPFGAGSVASGFAVISLGALVMAVYALALWLWMISRDRLTAIGWPEAAALLLLTLATGPVFTCRFGQIDTFILAICVTGVVLAQMHRPGWGGAILAFGGWVKVYPGLLMLPLLFDPERRARALIGFALGAALVAGAAALIFPISVWRTFFVEMLPIMSERTIVNIDNQSLVADWVRLSIDRQVAHHSYDAVVVPAAIRAAVMLAGAGTIAAMVLWARRHGASLLLVQAVAMAVISLIAPLGWGHSYAYVLPLLVTVAAMALTRARWGMLLIAGACWAMLLIPSHRQFGFLEGMPHGLWWLVNSRYAIAALLLIGCGFALARPAAAARAPARP